MQTCENKIYRRQQKYRNVLKKEFGLEASAQTTKKIMICNAGLVNGIQREDIIYTLKEYGAIDNLIMFLDKSYSFVVFQKLENALNCYKSLNGIAKLPGMRGPVYMLFVNEVPEVPVLIDFVSKPPGLVLIENFISEKEEIELLKFVNLEASGRASSMKNRYVKHYGYEFLYELNNVNKENPLKEGIPKECDFIFERFNQLPCTSNFSFYPNQLTINCYIPGQGIPPHIDTHSAFEEPILSLSLGSSVVMDFKNPEERHIGVLLPPRSLLVMSGESRYCWIHGITPRKRDTVFSKEYKGLTVQDRGYRTSFTFRKLRENACDCRFPEYCDSKRDTNCIFSEEMASELEKLHVHDVYDKISRHFSSTRHSPWPKVLSFLRNFPAGSFIVDIGCGNGKYFGHTPGLIEVGCDYSLSLAKECKERNFEVLICDCLRLPFQSNFIDGVISIAVLHHLATKTRRLKALKEIIRILKPRGKALIYVWAKEQFRNQKKSKYLRGNMKNEQQTFPRSCGEKKMTTSLSSDTLLSDVSVENLYPLEETLITKFGVVKLPVHSNRSAFKEQDLFVPWKMNLPQRNESKSTKTFMRFYHVFNEHELEDLCHELKNVNIITSYYDEGNWCVILEKCPMF